MSRQLRQSGEHYDPFRGMCASSFDERTLGVEMKQVLATIALIFVAFAPAQTQSATPAESLAAKVDRLFAS